MDLIRHLRCFLAVAEEGHFGHAAARLGMAQPPLSQRIQRLERELGVRLFDRGSRGVSVTPAGRLLLADATRLLESADALFATADRARRGEVGTLRAAVLPDTGAAAVTAVLTGFRTTSPGVQLDLHELGTTDQLARLADRSLDVGLVQHPCDLTGLELGPLLRRPLGVLTAATATPGASASAPGASSTPGASALGPPSGPVRLADLAGSALVLFPRAKAPGLHDEILTTCARHGYTPAEVREAENPQFVHGLVASGEAVAFAPHTPGAGPGTVWRPLAGAPLAWRLSTAWPSGGGSPAVRAFAAVVLRALCEHAGTTADIPDRPVHPRPTSEFLT
ncbi:LysR substrate-binding domain-containing protein [Allostreptomyces psammosilenae]|uniref:DNA-binding transcriptional LysR family regulator n=1 Tax=Allostreptomyces psammosilenae TaxID=1892865 RepID=A0A852ZZ55_9ACTN|nr:LysR family transcriptional regulator [Allostreptomyces psammosilenae]NYI07663.1 DNA-binding transcriptional LysR family regulator [Allostreptomyces psammosilenae]